MFSYNILVAQSWSDVDKQSAMLLLKPEIKGLNNIITYF